MSRWMYDPENGNGIYNLPIHENDTMLGGFTYRHIIDIARANLKKPISDEQMKTQIIEEVNMLLEDMWESYELCKENILAEANRID